MAVVVVLGEGGELGFGKGGLGLGLGWAEVSASVLVSVLRPREKLEMALMPALMPPWMPASTLWRNRMKGLLLSMAVLFLDDAPSLSLRPALALAMALALPSLPRLSAPMFSVSTQARSMQWHGNAMPMPMFG